MIIPELPDYLSSLGGEEFKGLIISLFTITAGLSRPFSGKLTDTIGRIPVMIYGALVSSIAGLLYPFASSIFLFLFLRFMHGMSTGFKPTATAAFIADVIPEHRRGEAMGYLGFFSSLGMAIGPLLGSEIASRYSLDIMFYTSSLCSFLSIAILLNMKETLIDRQKFNFKLLKVKKSEFIDKDAFPAAIVMMFMVYPFGVILTFIPDLTKSLHIMNKGTFFLFYTIATLLVRILSGKLSDVYGRVILLKISAIILSINFLFFMNISSVNQFLVTSFFYGIGTGIATPSIFAWTIDLTSNQHRGRAFSTLYIALEIGIGAGAVTSGWIYNYTHDFYYLFIMCFITSIISLIYLQYYSFIKKNEVYIQK